jgi:hypothetical protein
MTTTTRTASRVSRTRATSATRAPVTEPVDRRFISKVTVARTSVDVPMLVLRGEWLKAIGFPIGAKAFLSTDKRGDIALTRPGLTRRSGCACSKRNPDEELVSEGHTGDGPDLW